MIREVLDWAHEGTRHDIPFCCGLRFGFDCARPKPFARFFPRIVPRLARALSLRHHFAIWDGQGYVPCE